MQLNQIKCKAVKVDTDSKICPGIAKITEGEEFVINGRTPEGNGMCSNAFCALSNAAFVMMASEDKPVSENGNVQRLCPHGAVTYNLSRINQK